MIIDNTSFVLAVDVDGVQAEYDRGLAEVVCRGRDIHVDDLPPAADWSFSNWDFGDGDFMKYHTRLIEEHGLANLKPMDGVADVMQRFSDVGIYVRVVTHRLVLKGYHKTIVTDTAEWLDKNAIPYRDICFAANKSTVGADLYIDDAPHNYEALVEAGIPCVLYEQPYNLDIDAPMRARNWQEVEQHVMDYFTKWKEDNGRS